MFHLIPSELFSSENVIIFNGLVIAVVAVKEFFVIIKLIQERSK